jgi:hypothetical protein
MNIVLGCGMRLLPKASALIDSMGLLEVHQYEARVRLAVCGPACQSLCDNKTVWKMRGV